jgi:hypothetical protein
LQHTLSGAYPALDQIKGIIDNAPVSPVFWACCQLADIDSLQVIANSDMDMILVNEDSLALLVVQCELLEF